MHPEIHNSSTGSTSSDTAHRIFISATRLFAAKGYAGTSTKEICEDAKVNIAALHYHFKSKEDLFWNIVKSFGTKRLESIQRILQTPESQEEVRIRLKLFLQEVIESYLGNMDSFQIIHREIELLRNNPEVIRNTFLKNYKTLVKFLAEAKESELISSKTDPDLAAEFLYSQISNKVQNDKISYVYTGKTISDPVYKKKWIEEALRLFLDGIGK